MMIEIKLCKSEMIRAMQHYMDTVLFKQSPGEVKNVKEIRNNLDFGFYISISERVKE